MSQQPSRSDRTTFFFSLIQRQRIHGRWRLASFQRRAFHTVLLNRERALPSIPWSPSTATLSFENPFQGDLNSWRELNRAQTINTTKRVKFPCLSRLEQSTDRLPPPDSRGHCRLQFAWNCGAIFPRSPCSHAWANRSRRNLRRRGSAGCVYRRLCVPRPREFRRWIRLYGCIRIPISCGTSGTAHGRPRPISIKREGAKSRAKDPGASKRKSRSRKTWDLSFPGSLSRSFKVRLLVRRAMPEYLQILQRYRVRVRRAFKVPRWDWIRRIDGKQRSSLPSRHPQFRKIARLAWPRLGVAESRRIGETRNVSKSADDDGAGEEGRGEDKWTGRGGKDIRDER